MVVCGFSFRGPASISVLSTNGPVRRPEVDPRLARWAGTEPHLRLLFQTLAKPV